MREKRNNRRRQERPQRPDRPARPTRDNIIDLGGGRSSPQATDAQAKERPTSRQDSGEPTGLYLARGIISQMELRSESSFRPNQPDFESIYALTGVNPNEPDTLHSFASESVVQDARPETVIPITSEIIEHIKEERQDDGPVRVVVILHTHPAPGNIAQPSSNDLRFFEQAGKSISDAFSDSKVYFGVHAMSGDHRRTRESISNTAEHRLRWVSIYREHEVALFDAAGREEKVTVDERA